MLERVTIEKGHYSKLLKDQYQLGKQTRKMQELQQKYRALEKRHYELLLNSPERAEEIVKLGDYVESVVTDEE